MLEQQRHPDAEPKLGRNTQREQSLMHRGGHRNVLKSMGRQVRPGLVPAMPIGSFVSRHSRSLVAHVSARVSCAFRGHSYRIECGGRALPGLCSVQVDVHQFINWTVSHSAIAESAIIVLGFVSAKQSPEAFLRTQPEWTI